MPFLAKLRGGLKRRFKMYNYTEKDDSVNMSVSGTSSKNWTIQGGNSTLEDPLVDPLMKPMDLSNRQSKFDSVDPLDIPLPPEFPDVVDELPLPEEKVINNLEQLSDVPPKFLAPKVKDQIQQVVDPRPTDFDQRPDLPKNSGAKYGYGSDQLYGKNGPKVTDVRQGDLGDCFLLGQLAAITARAPNHIKDMVEVVDEGKYRVRFFERGGKENWVAVDAKLPLDIMREPKFARSENANIIWSAIIEKAYAKLHGGYEKIDSGGFSERTSLLLLGQKNEHIEFKNRDPQETIGEIDSRMKSGHAVVGELKNHVVAITKVDVNNGKMFVYDQAGSSKWMTVKQFEQEGYIAIKAGKIPNKNL